MKIVIFIFVLYVTQKIKLNFRKKCQKLKLPKERTFAKSVFNKK